MRKILNEEFPELEVETPVLYSWNGMTADELRRSIRVIKDNGYVEYTSVFSRQMIFTFRQ